ncbi:MAG: T9SS type A sorting domain-containing protein [Flavobacteriales bacterium]|nr:T9SS type A sorting domain-containing protein [Flavobacteriales bacterium]
MPHSSTPLLSLIACALLLVAPTQAQTYQRLFGGTDLDAALATTRTVDGGYALVGFTRSFGLPGEEASLVKTDAMGTLLWSRVFSAPGDDRFMGIAAASDGGTLLCGTTTSFSNSTDILLIRTDANGDTLWCRAVGDAADNTAYAAVQADDGGFLVCGASATTTGNGSDLYLLRTDADGDTLWTRCFGGIYGDWANAVQKTADGDYLIAGSTSTFGEGQEDYYLLKVDDNGTLLFSRTYGGPLMDQAWGLVLTADGGCILAGSTYSFGIPTRSVYLVRTDAIGDTLWTGVYDTGGIFGGWAFDVAECTDGGFVVGGEAVDLKVDANGDLLWSYTLLTGTTPVHVFCEPQPDGGVLFIGTGGYVNGGLGWSDMHMVRTDATVWSGCNQMVVPLGSAHTPTVVSSPATAQLTCAMTVAAAPFTVGTGGSTAVLCLAMGTDGAEAEESISATPNPSDGVFMLHYPHSAAHTVEVHDALGACVLRTVVPTSGQLRLDLRQMPVGLYVVTSNDGQRTIRTRVIIER